MAELGEASQQRLSALETSVEAAVLSQRQRFEHFCSLLGDLQKHKEAATAELQVNLTLATACSHH